MASLNMAKLNMVNMNTLFKKGYLLAGVIMAANMYIINEVKATANEKEAMDTEENKDKDRKVENKDSLNSLFKNVLDCKNYINFIGGMASSCANNYFKWWNYNPGWYRQFGCFGWRSGRFIKDIFQIDINLNIGRGAGWMLLYFLDPLITKLWKKGNPEDTKVKDLLVKETQKTGLKDFIFSCAPGFISVPLAIHISNFSISISLDSILWMGIGKILELKDKKGEEDSGQIDIHNADTPVRIVTKIDN